jgi:hypothetical protein
MTKAMTTPIATRVSRHTKAITFHRAALNQASLPKATQIGRMRLKILDVMKAVVVTKMQF